MAMPGSPWANLLWLMSMLSASPASSAAGLEMKNGASVWAMRKFDRGSFSVRMKVVGSGASVEATFEPSP